VILKNKTRKILSFLLIFVILFSNVLYAKDNSKNEERIIKENIQQIGPGTYFKQTDFQTANTKFKINTVYTTIGTKYIKVEAADNGRAIGTATVTKQAELKSLEDSRVIGAINGDFFYVNELTGLPSGTCIIDGEIRTALPESTIFGVTSKGNCFISDIEMNAFATIGKKKYEIKGVNRVRWDNQLILYTPSFSKPTNTKGNGTEVIIKGLELPIKSNMKYKGVVEKIYRDVENIEIPEDRIVLSGQGAAAEFLNELKEDDEVSFEINFNRKDIEHAISGNPRLIANGEIAEDIEKRSDAKSRHPRTAVGIKDGQVIFITVDGRQKGYSDGMTLYELADFMLEQGIENAINLDGGGSTAMIARKQGYISSRIINSPSDGRERAVANSLQIISDAPLSKPEKVFFGKSSLKIFKNSNYTPTTYGLDQYYNRVDLKPTEIEYKIGGGIGKINKEGLFVSGNTSGQGFIEAAIGNSKSKIEVEVYNKVASLRILNSYMSLEPGEKVQMEVKAYNEKGEEIVISPTAVTWAATEDFGEFDKSGIFTAGKNMIEGKIIAKAGDVTSVVDARIGNMPIVLEGFENADNIELKSIKADISGRPSGNGEPVILGTSSYKMEYDMSTGEEGTSAAYLNFKKNIPVPGRPIEIGVWVYGNESGNWLRGTYINASGERKVVNFSNQGKFNWKGWKFAYAEIPKDEKYPISFEQIYVAEPNEENKTKSVVYFDNLTALYKEGEDYYNPEVVEINIADKEELDEKPDEIIIKVRDKGEGIDPKSIVLLLDNIQVKTEYNEKTETITYRVSDRISKGKHEIWLRLRDKAGNGLNPEYKSTFIIKK